MKKKLMRFFVFVVLMTLLVCSLDTITFAASVLPPDIMPVVIVSGSDYEMGYQYGQQVGQYIEARKNETWASRLKSRSYDEVLSALKGVQHYVQEYTPELIDQMKGMADGASSAGYNLSYIDILLINSSFPSLTYSNYPEGAEEEKLPPEKGCSVFSAWGNTTTDGSLIGGDSYDGTFTYQVVVVAFPDKGNNWIGGMKAGELANHFAMNNKGLWLGNSGGGGSKRKVDSDFGINWRFMYQHLARFANNAVEAKDMTLGWQLNGVENFHYVDIHGNAFVVEMTAALKSVRKSGDFDEIDCLFSTNNYLNAEMIPTKEGEEQFIKQHGGYGAYAAPRNMMIWDMLHNYQGNVDLEFAKMMWRFPGTPPPNPPEGGWDAVIHRPTNEWVSISTPDDGDKGFSYICTGPVGRVIHSSKNSKGGTMRSSYPLINGTHTFYKLVLASTPAKLVEEAQNTAKDDIATAYKEFMMLNPTDSGFAAMNDLYALANTEYYEGFHAYNQALLASGNEMLASFAKAATAFTRSQAHAQQLYEALVPPPTSPTELGLKPFGGDWAEWETRVGQAN